MSKFLKLLFFLYSSLICSNKLQIDAVSGDAYLSYHAELLSKVDRTKNLTNFVQAMISAKKEANFPVAFDIWIGGKDILLRIEKNWARERAFIQAHNKNNFSSEVS